jgi:hypothetical protein
MPAAPSIACVSKSLDTGPMLSTQCPETPAPELPRAAASADAPTGVRRDAPRAEARPLIPGGPWDAESAEALTRLYESEEGDLSKPASRERAVHPREPGRAHAWPPDSADTSWLQSHLAHLAKRLQDSLIQASPEKLFGELNARLDAIEQRFSAALGRVAQRTDLDGLKSIESDVMALAAQLERARDRLDEISAVEDEVRGLARKLDEAGEQRAGTLEKLLRDCIAEWREGEQRTAGALQNLEEAVNRVGDSVDAMEASRPAPDLSVPALPASEPDAPAGVVGFRAGGAWTPRGTYQSMLDAADYAPRPAEAEPQDGPPLAALAREDGTLPAAAVEWAARPADDEAAEPPERPARLPGGWQIAALRARMRQAPRGDFALLDGAVRAAEAARRASLSLLLAVGAAIVAGSTYLTYLLLQTVTAPTPPMRPAATAPALSPTGGKPELADPGGRRGYGEDAS